MRKKNDVYLSKNLKVTNRILTYQGNPWVQWIDHCLSTFKAPSVKNSNYFDSMYNYRRKINDEYIFIEKSKSFKSNPYISWQSLISRHWTLTFASPSVITDTWTTTPLITQVDDFLRFDIILISKMKKKVNKKYFIRREKSLIYLRATDSYELWRKNEVAVNKLRFNVKFCAGF